MSKQSATPKTVSEVIDIINSSPASMFTKSDVIALVKSIETDQRTSAFSEEQVEELVEHIRHEMYVGIDESDLYDKESAQFEIEDGNVIVLTHIDIDTDYTIDVAVQATRDWFEKHVL